MHAAKRASIERYLINGQKMRFYSEVHFNGRSRQQNIILKLLFALDLTKLLFFSVMVFAVVEKAGTTVMNHEEELDSWSVIINGEVRIDQVKGESKDFINIEEFLSVFVALQ